MFLKLTRQIGKPVCVMLYAFFSALAARKKPAPLLILFLMHAAEYLLIGRKVAEEKHLSAGEGLLKCLCFGCTWWLPLKKG